MRNKNGEDTFLSLSLSLTHTHTHTHNTHTHTRAHGGRERGREGGRKGTYRCKQVQTLTTSKRTGSPPGPPPASRAISCMVDSTSPFSE